jgi:two-component system nitrogen regulation response regulator GlnG
MSRVLVVDDEEGICWAFREFLAEEGHRVEVAATAEEGLGMAAQEAPDAVVLDIRLPGMDGLTALGEFRRIASRAPVVVMTAFGSLETAVRAVESGAFDYLVKPFDLDRAATVVRRALAEGRLAGTCDEVRVRADGDEAMVGASPPMQELFRRIALVAASDVPVLITGESGTGKELVARAIHRYSPRHDGPFLPVCLPALSPGLVESELFGHVRGAFTDAQRDRAGLLELAKGGTVLLDEIGDVPPAMQVKLLRAIEQREVTPVGDVRARPTDIRVVAATNRPLGRLIESGEFREDLYFRLGVFTIEVPPLRQRRDDIPLLAEHFLRRCRLADPGGPTLSPEAASELCSRPWLGNVRELRNAIEHAAIVARGRTIHPEHLPPSPRPSRSESSPSDEERILGQRLTEWARRVVDEGGASLYERFLGLVEPPLLRAVLDRCQGRRTNAANTLGIHRATLREKLRRYGIGTPE